MLITVIICHIALLAYVVLGILLMSGIMVAGMIRSGVRIGTIEQECWMYLFDIHVLEQYGNDDGKLKNGFLNTAWNIITWPFLIKEFRECCNAVNEIWMKKHSESTTT